MKVLVLSDLHLGVPASRVAGFLDDLRRVARQYDRVILNGDTLDRYEAPACVPHAESLRKQALEVCGSRSGPPDFVMGNHDPALSSTEWVYLEESGTLIFHGDCIADCTHPTKREERVMEVRLRQHWEEIGGRPAGFVKLSNAFRTLQARHLREHPMTHEPRDTLKYLVSVTFPPRKPLDILHYWWRAPRLVAKLSRTFPKPVRYAVVGHSHRPGHWVVGGISVLNTGSFMPLSEPYAVCIEGASVTWRRLLPMLRSQHSYLFPSMSQPRAHSKQAKA
jgi:UDP-2,3-diacylglucosamine pyrophosphatase LpxH